MTIIFISAKNLAIDSLDVLMSLDGHLCMESATEVDNFLKIYDDFPPGNVTFFQRTYESGNGLSINSSFKSLMHLPLFT